ncbi:AGAP005330-PA [Anopheles gambiae str. PEST]|uniref:AGAP005330-PA n=1 Tax=Anopheles gambiae TaxID=7165 RepID=Q5TRR4_ANOGA|nr:AGAP005330-PA [Anopheles gambiae str. PEST]
MQLKFMKTIVEAQDHLYRVAGLCWSANNQKLAVATADRTILLFDENGERRDKFSTKAADPNAMKNSYVIRGITFSPDSSRLAVAQSDSIVYVYKLGEQWNEKKVICNKFPQGAAVTCISWLAGGLIVAGLEDGKVRSLYCKNNKSKTLYGTDSMVVTLAQNTKGTGVLSGHEDGSVVRFLLVEEPGEPTGRLLQHPVAPVALAWPQGGIVVAGCDKKICFYDLQGRAMRTFDYARDEMEREFTVAAASPNGQAVAVGSYDRLRIFSWSPRQNAWAESLCKTIPNLYTVTAVCWRKDGSRLAVGSLCGAVLAYESVLRRTIWQDKFELTFVAPSQVLLRSLHEPITTMLVESQLGLEIDDIRIMGKDSYLVGRTEDSLILCDLTRSLTSEIPWIATGRHERFYFENPTVALIFNAGELSLVEYGEHYILGSVRTEFVNPHVISVRLNERGNTRNNKKLAYLLDMKTVCVVDLMLQSTIAQISHDSKIDWLELSETGHKLLFRDRKMRLVLVDVGTGQKQTLLAKVAFVQWVPSSDVAVAQSDTNLAVWYNIDLPEHVTMMPVRGDVVDVLREDGRTEIITREAASEHVYPLDEGLVEFGTAVNDSDFGRAIFYLESLGDRPAAKAMWHNLANIALAQQNLRVAQRCFAALGNASKTFYLGEMIKIAERYEETTGPGMTCPEVRAMMALLGGDLRTAERIYIEQGDIEAALAMYTKLRRWDDAIKLAERRGYHGLPELKEAQMEFLLTTSQEEKAGEVLEERGEKDKAMTLYMKANKPVKAAKLALKTPHLLSNENLVTRVSASLIKAELFELAAELANRTGQQQTAITLYRKGGAYARAIELARYVTPDDVTSLEEEWGDWLVGKRQLDASISHYIEAGCTVKALEAAVGAKQWRKAVQIAKVVDDPEEIQKYAVELAEHLCQIGDVKTAEELLVRAELYREAVQLLNKHGQWEKAFDIADRFLPGADVREMFVALAKGLEQEGKYRDAERVLLTVNEPDLAINMYKELELYDSMIRLVERYHKSLLEQTHLNLGRQLESKGRFKNAEVHFLAAGDWKAAVHMYCTAGKWEEAHRVAKQKGGQPASEQVAFMWAKSLPIEGAARLLTKMSLLDSCIAYACEAGQFDFALELCKVSGRSADDVHLKIAMALEDDGKFTEAEAEFLLANKPREAIMMHTHGGDWKSALRVAEKYLPEAVHEVLLSQANSALEARNYPEYEALMIRADRPDLILEHYKEYNMVADALRIAKEYVPGAVAELQKLYTRMNRGTGESTDSRYLLQKASEHARNEEFRRATECLLQITEANADEPTVTRALLRAAEICNQFLEGPEAIEMARELGPRLIEINQIGPAAQLYLAAELPQEAVDVFIRTDNWAKARRLAKEIDPQLVVYVEAQQKARLRNQGNVEQLADIDMVGALDLLAEQGQWIRCIEKAKQHSVPVLQKYMAQYAAQLIRDGDCVAALNLYLEHGVPPVAANFNIYSRIALECFALREPDAGATVWKNVRTFLLNLVQALRGSDQGEAEVIDRFEQLLVIAHYYATRAACRQAPALQSIAVKISVALLRYTDIIPCDKGYYEAGMDLRGLGRESEAFVILNHYLDVCEAIEEGSGNLVDHSDLSSTDFPSSVPIPAELHLKNELQLHEEIREWVLAVSMDQKVDQALPTDDRNMYEASLGLSDQPCLVSGYPVMGRQPVVFQRTHRLANRDAWSKLTVAARMAPQTDIPGVIDFIEKWCGPANFLSG